MTNRLDVCVSILAALYCTMDSQQREQGSHSTSKNLHQRTRSGLNRTSRVKPLDWNHSSADADGKGGRQER